MMNDRNEYARVVGIMQPPNRLWAALFQTSHVMEVARENEIRQLGISMMQSAVLWVAKVVEPPVTPGKLSKWLLRKPNSITGLLDRMERQGLITRVKDKKANHTIVALTELGEDIRKKSASNMKVIHNITSALSDEEIERTIEAMLVLRTKAIQEIAAQQQVFLP